MSFVPGRSGGGGEAAAQLGVLMTPHHSTSNVAGTRTLSTGTSVAVYVGRAPKDMASAIVCYKVAVAGNSFTWAEVAIAKGPINPGGNATLTIVGHADATAAFSASAVAQTTVAVASGQEIVAGDDLWVIFAKASTGSPQFRSSTNGGDELAIGLQQTSALRPSTNVGTANAWTIESGGSNVPIMCAVVVPA